VALNELIIKNNIADRLKGRTSYILKELKKNGILNLYFSSVEISRNIIIIWKDIISKYIIQDLNDEKFNISEFPVENDYN
jgi:hypothetical protein